MKKQHFYKGFSLVELSVVMLIVGIVFVGATIGLQSFKHSAYFGEGHKSLEYSKKQIINFAVINKYLPCPDTDTPPDGLENRTTVGGFEACSNAIGGVPYLDIGLKEPDVLDGWGNPFRYAVNTNATTASVCDKTSGGSYFCNEAANNIAWFTYQDTPPLAGNPGAGNYTVCNENTTTCDASSTDLVTDAAVAILVAYNEDGAQALANCASYSGATEENCDTDLYYHRQSRSIEEGQFFDDQILILSGYDIKAKVLSNVTSWNSFSSTGAPGSPEPTYEGYDFTDEDKTTYLQDNNIDEDDAIYVNRNVMTDLDLGDGNDYVMIGNDLQSETIWDGRLVDGRTEGTYFDDGTTVHDGSHADLNAGAGDDQIYIVNDAYSQVDLGEGDDKFVIGGELKEGLLGGDGNDEAWIQGSYVGGGVISSDSDTDVNTGWTRNPEPEGTDVSVTQTIDGNETTTVTTTTEIEYIDTWYSWTRVRETITTEMVVTENTTVDLGSGDDVVWLGNTEDPSSGQLNNPIEGGDGNDTLVLENVDQWSDLTTEQQNNISGFELIIFADDGSGNRNHCEWDSCGQ